VQTILPVLKSGQEDVYKLLGNFVKYLRTETTNSHDLTATSIKLYVAGCRSYLQHNDIDILQSKFKSKITMPRIYREDQEAIDANDIKEILHHCNNRRLKAYLLVLASGGMRAMEALTLRESDIDFSGIDFADPNDTSEPAVVRIRAEYAKTRVERRIFISNEAARYLHDWINWTYRDKSQDSTTRRITRQRMPDDLIFSSRTYTGVYPTGLYNRLLTEFQKVLELAHLSTRKENGVYKRRHVTFHSFRRFVKTTIANQTRNDAYSEWFLGHANRYYVNKPEKVKRIYKEECMKYLTFLDYATIEAEGRSFNAKFKELQNENKQLRTEIVELKQEKASKAEASTIQMAEMYDTIKEQKQAIAQLQKQMAEMQAKQVENNKE
jgi:integrase